MDIDFADAPFDLKKTRPHEIEEVFEDPFALRLLPDTDREDGQIRYYLLGKTINNRGLFLAFWSNGKKARVISARDLSDDECAYYDRTAAEIR